MHDRLQSLTVGTTISFRLVGRNAWFRSVEAANGHPIGLYSQCTNERHRVGLKSNRTYLVACLILFIGETVRKWWSQADGQLI